MGEKGRRGRKVFEEFGNVGVCFWVVAFFFRQSGTESYLDLGIGFCS
jgi:hypothetical protein